MIRLTTQKRPDAVRMLVLKQNSIEETFPGGLHDLDRR